MATVFEETMQPTSGTTTSIWIATAATPPEEAGRAGFVLLNEYDFVKPDNVDYFLVFRINQ